VAQVGAVGTGAASNPLLDQSRKRNIPIEVTMIDVWFYANPARVLPSQTLV
jgi:hypothetical protein